jgi:23S rRNA (adenine2030-N6)-methyltransferase
MLSYQHRYHAGCFADIHKHLILVAILQHLQKKESPFGVLDLYAGEGLYDLRSAESQKNGEYRQGFSRLLKKVAMPKLVQAFLGAVDQYNPAEEKRFYPGSPAIINHFLRENDRGIFCELHPQALLALKANFAKVPNCHVHERDANEAMRALLPLKEKRGLIFIDPSYEIKTEYQTIAEKVINIYPQFSQGIYAIWYPLLPTGYHAQLLEAFKAANFPSMWSCEWIADHRKERTGMYGSGMIVINPPWQLDVVIKDTFKSLHENLFVDGKFYQRWLSVPVA